MNEEERLKKKLELERLKKLMLKKQKELEEPEMIEPSKPLPSTIPVEPQDMDYQHQPYNYPQSPKLSLPFMKPKQKPRYVPPQQRPNPSENITKAQAAFEVAGHLDSKRIMAMAGIIEAIVVLAVTMFNTSWGFGAAAVFSFYWIFELWRMLRKRQYLRMNYGV